MPVVNYPATTGGGGAGTWGSITGTLSDQTDLNTSLNNRPTKVNPSVVDDIVVFSNTTGGHKDSNKKTTDFAAADHNHDLAYLGISAKAADSDKLDGNDSTAFATSGHDHTGVYEPASADFTSKVSAASESVAGKAEIATLSEVNAGTDNGRIVSPDGLAGSQFGTREIHLTVFTYSTAVATGDGKRYFKVPASLNGHNIISVAVTNGAAASSSGNVTVMIARGRQSNATTIHTFADVLSTALTIDATEWDSKDATTAAVIDTNNDDLATGDLLRVDVDGAGTGSQGLYVVIGTRMP